MATISRYPFMSHLRTTSTMHVSHLAGGTLRRSGTGAAFWFRPLGAALSEVPVDDREQPIVVPVRTSDLQEVSVPGVVVYRFTDPVLAATRIDFSIDLRHGRWERAPLESVGAAIQGAAAAAVTQALAGRDLPATLTLSTGELAQHVGAALASDERLTSVGLTVVGVRFGMLRPEADVERALQMPARESIQQEADKATFERRALAVEREAAIGQNELTSKIDLATRREELIGREGANDRRGAEAKAAADAIAVRAQAERTIALAQAQAEADRLIGEATAAAQRAALAASAEVPTEVLLALAAREAAANLPHVDQLVLTPDLVSGLLAQLSGPRQVA